MPRNINRKKNESWLNEPRAIIIAALITGAFAIAAVLIPFSANQQNLVQTLVTPSPSFSPSLTTQEIAAATIVPSQTHIPTTAPTATVEPSNTPKPTVDIDATVSARIQQTSTAAAAFNLTIPPTHTLLPTGTPTHTPTAPTATSQTLDMEVARAFPCDATIRGSATVLRIVYNEPNSRASIIRTARNGDAMRLLDTVLEAGRIRWYQIAERDNLPLGWVLSNYIHLSDNCPQ